MGRASHIILSLLEDHSYSCLMADVPEELTQKLLKWNKQHIPESVLYTEEEGHGREEIPHVTIKWGLLDDKPSKALKAILSETKPFTATIGEVSLFENEKFDVVKLTIKSDGLHKLHKRIKEEIPNEDTYPTYKPHLTLAYVKKGEGKRFVGKRPLRGEESTFEIKQLTFGSKDDTKKKLSLTEDVSELVYFTIIRQFSAVKSKGRCDIYRIPVRLAEQIIDEEYGKVLHPVEHEPDDWLTSDLLPMLNWDENLYLEVAEKLAPHAEVVLKLVPFVYDSPTGITLIDWDKGDFEAHVVYPPEFKALLANPKSR